MPAGAEMTSRKEVEQCTEDFFRLHWGLGFPPPPWDFSWNWHGAVPNYRLAGVYALLRGDELLYIGLGASRGGGIYQDRGLSRRLMSHVFLRDRSNSTGYLPREKWKALKVDVVGTIGFPQEANYLAPALEDYLIGRLTPPQNHVKRQAD